MNRCDGGCNNVDGPFGRIYVPNKKKDVNLKLFKMIKGIKESTTLDKHIIFE